MEEENSNTNSACLNCPKLTKNIRGLEEKITKLESDNLLGSLKCAKLTKDLEDINVSDELKKKSWNDERIALQAKEVKDDFKTRFISRPGQNFVPFMTVKE